MRDENGINEQKIMVENLQEMMSAATKEIAQMGGVSAKQMTNCVAFLDACQKEGIGPEGLVSEIKKGLKMCLEKNDTRTHLKYVQLLTKVMMDVQLHLKPLLGTVNSVINSNKPKAPLKEIPETPDTEKTEEELQAEEDLIDLELKDMEESTQDNDPALEDYG